MSDDNIPPKGNVHQEYGDVPSDVQSKVSPENASKRSPNGNTHQEMQNKRRSATISQSSEESVVSPVHHVTRICPRVNCQEKIVSKDYDNTEHELNSQLIGFFSGGGKTVAW